MTGIPYNIKLRAAPMATGIAVGMVCIILYFAAYAFTLVRPSPGMSLDEFSKIAPAPYKVFYVESGDGKRVFWLGRLETWRFPSGRSCYIFSDELKLLEWTEDMGEGGPIGAKFRAISGVGKELHWSDAVAHARNSCKEGCNPVLRSSPENRLFAE